MARTVRGRAQAWNEFALIDEIRRLSVGGGGKDRLTIGDDASAHRPSAGLLELVTCDALVENVHWSWKWCGAEAVGRKLAAVNLSDIAAMGGTPQRAHLVLALPPAVPTQQVLRLVRGLVETLKAHGARLVGGDTNLSSGPMMLSLTLQGTVPPKRMLTRSGARPGDWLLVTGNVGAAAAGLAELSRAAAPLRIRSYAAQRLREPEPRLAEGRWLAQCGHVHAMLDVSDGLAGDVRRLGEGSEVGVRLYADRLPVVYDTRRMAARLRRPAWALALEGGEDYELLFAVSPTQADAVSRALRKQTGMHSTVIGEVTPKRQGYTVVVPEGKTVPLPHGWEHNRLVGKK